jgi:acyl transferase domain-containing protein
MHLAGPVRAVLDGVAHHVAVDALFHAASVFTIGEQTTRDALRNASSAPKLAIFAHVTWELCLDGALVRRVGLAALLDAVRSSIRAVRPDAHHRAALASAPSLGARSVEERDRFEARVDQILDAIALGPWVAGYATGAGIVERLEGVRARLRLAPLPAVDRDSVGRALGGLAGRADEALDEIASWDSSVSSSNLT